MTTHSDIKLTAYSHGAGCGCKIAPAVLKEILQSYQQFPTDPNLLVGYESSDDAAVYDLGNGTSIISTTDFFMPIVDDPEPLAASLQPTRLATFMRWVANPSWRSRF